MYTVFLAGGIASGKSTVAQTLERLGAIRCDLDQVSREVCRPGSPALVELGRRFGTDLVDPKTGELNRHLLAERAFATQEGTRDLESIELPFISRRLAEVLADAASSKDANHPVEVVEVPLLDRVEDLIPSVDEVLCVTCPLEVRRNRAVGRGMDVADFDRRVAQQPDDDYLRAHANSVFDNAGTPEELTHQVRTWWQKRADTGWRHV